MIVPLHHDKRIARAILRSEIPRLLRTPTSPANVQALSLAERIEREPLVSSQDLTLRRFDRSRPLVDKSAQELPERTLADEADAGAVRLVEYG
jgi:hypothetical protein